MVASRTWSVCQVWWGLCMRTRCVTTPWGRLMLMLVPSPPPCVCAWCREDAERAIRALNGFGYDNLILKVEYAAPRAERP